MAHSTSKLKQQTAVDALSDSVCMINSTESWGTGFRVGDKYIMTANHVIGNVDLPDKTCYADFNVIDSKVKPKKFGLKEVVYRNKDLDVAVVELQCKSLEDLPKPFIHFCPPMYEGSFQVIGYQTGAMGAEKEHNVVDKMFDQRQLETKEKLSKLEKQSQEIAKLTYGLTESSEYNYLFRCKFTTGSSGSPGVVVRGENAYVATILIRGHPLWYYEGTVYEDVLFEWNDEDRIEEGVNMKSLFDAMQSENKTLSNEVFKFGVEI